MKNCLFQVGLEACLEWVVLIDVGRKTQPVVCSTIP